MFCCGVVFMLNILDIMAWNCNRYNHQCIDANLCPWRQIYSNLVTTLATAIALLNNCSCLVLLTLRNMSQIMLIKSVYFPNIDFKPRLTTLLQCHYIDLTLWAYYFSEKPLDFMNMLSESAEGSEIWMGFLVHYIVPPILRRIRVV